MYPGRAGASGILHGRGLQVGKIFFLKKMEKANSRRVESTGTFKVILVLKQKYPADSLDFLGRKPLSKD